MLIATREFLTKALFRNFVSQIEAVELVDLLVDRLAFLVQDRDQFCLPRDLSISTFQVVTKVRNGAVPRVLKYTSPLTAGSKSPYKAPIRSQVPSGISGVLQEVWQALNVRLPLELTQTLVEGTP